jgi:osmotically-inducible protein OsmY
MNRKRRFSATVLLALMLIALGASNALAQGNYVEDNAISDRVRTAIHKDPVLRMMEITVETRDAVVQLRGFVRTMADIGKAVALVRAVPGVAAVRNGLQVANQPSRA